MAIFASTNVFTASALFGELPSVDTVTGRPASVSVDDAWPVTVPVELDVKVIVHCPFASVFAPAFVHEPVGAECVAPCASVSVTATCSPWAFTKPFPSPVSFHSVTVNVCGTPIRFVADCAIVILASTNVFTASALFGEFPSVDTVTGKPASVRVDEACPVTVPVVFDLNVIVHWPLASVFGPAVVHEPVGAVWEAPFASV